MAEPVPQRVVVVRAGEGLCAIPVAAVVETLRPLPVRPLGGAPGYVLGVAVVRGAPAPVIDLAGLLGRAPERAAQRWVVVRCGARTAALAVRAVEGVAPLPAAGAPVPLLAGAAGGAVASLRALDQELLVVLEACRVVPEELPRAAGGSGA